MGTKTAKEFKFSNGDSAVDEVTGFKGIITGTCFYSTGCNRYLVSAKVEKEGKEPTELWFDEDRLVVAK